MASLTCPDCGVRVQPEDLICYRCGAHLARMPRHDEDVAPPTVSQQTLNTGAQQTRKGAALSGVVLQITFPAGTIDVPAGTSVLLGRDPAESLVAAAFAQYDNVSRRHATVRVDDTGNATVRDEGSTNGTWVNGDRALPGADVRLVDGDIIRLAADVTGRVSLPRMEPDPASLLRDR